MKIFLSIILGSIITVVIVCLIVLIWQHFPLGSDGRINNLWLPVIFGTLIAMFITSIISLN